jgi:Fe-S cluster assembly protein SufD
MSAPQAVYGNDYRAVQDALPGAGVHWLQGLRDNAVERLLERGFPTTRDEEWKYTDLRSLTRRHYSPPGHRRQIAAASLQPWVWKDEPAYRLVFIDSHCAPELCTTDPNQTGVSITSLARVLEERPESLAGILGRNVDTGQPGFNAFNTAFMRDGACIELGQGVVLDRPIHLLFVATGRDAGLSALRNIIVGGANSRATVVESYVALGDAASLTSAVTEITLESGAALEHCKLGQESESASHMASIHVAQERDSRFTSHNFALGGRLVRNDLQVALNGAGAEAVLNGLSVTRGRQHVDNRTLIDHNKPRASSHESYRGVLDGRSRCVFNGRIVVHKDAQGTAARQASHNLLLSDAAEVDAKPQLEIYADDVKCAHGCTVGQLDQEALFYFRSRGVAEELARSYLIYAFAADVLQPVRLKPVRRLLEQELAGRLMVAGALDLFREEMPGQSTAGVDV